MMYYHDVTIILGVLMIDSPVRSGFGVSTVYATITTQDEDTLSRAQKAMQIWQAFVYIYEGPE